MKNKTVVSNDAAVMPSMQKIPQSGADAQKGAVMPPMQKIPAPPPQPQNNGK
jgi:hypothetical protein